MIKDYCNKQLFYQHLGQTSKHPLALEVEKASGIYLYTPSGKKYVDLASGVCVNNFGHTHPKIVEAVNQQAKKYMHLMVYGEYIQQPQIEYAKKLSSILPENLESIYYVNSGSEAIEGAIKVSKRYTKRSEIIAFRNAYHGSTHGALSLGGESLKNAFRPLLPDIKLLHFNSKHDIAKITRNTACVVIEPIQAEAGVIIPEENYLKALSAHCRNCEALLIFDEVQTGFGRCGTMFAFQQYNMIPDILVLAKAMGGGMPIGGFVSSKEILDTLSENPTAGHKTTFGGHPLSAVAANAALDILLETNILSQVNRKGDLLFDMLKNHPKIVEIRRKGLLLAVELKGKKVASKAVNALFNKGFITDKFLFHANAFRIAPPLTVSEKEIEKIGKTIYKALNSI